MNTVARYLRVNRKAVEAEDICSLELVDPEGGSLPVFTAGSHIDLSLGDGIVRQYSLYNDPQETHRYQIAILRDPNSRGGSIRVHDLQEGQLVGVSDPKNHFALRSDASHSILVAGGIGVTPLMSMAEHLSRGDASFEMHYCTRSQSRTAFSKRLSESGFASKVALYHDDAPDTQTLPLQNVLTKRSPSTHLYVCGPTGFMDWVLKAAANAGWTDSQVHREYFASAAMNTGGDKAFEIQISSSGQIITVAADQTVVAALAAAGFELSTSCEQGVCGTCMTRVIEGIPDHRDMYLTEDEKAKCDQFLPCCSRSKSDRLVLEL